MPDIRTLGLTISRALDSFQEAQNSVRSRSASAPPSTPALDDRYLIASGASDAWLEHDGEIARWLGTGWQYVAPQEGFTLWVDDEDEQITFDGVTWRSGGEVGEAGGAFLRDGSLPLTGDMNAGNQRIKSVGAPRADTDAARLVDIFAIGSAAYVADEPLGALRAVAVTAPGRLRYARLPEVSALAPVGITTAASLTGGIVQMQTQGVLQDPFFTFAPGPVLLGLNGVLTQEQPAGVLIRVVMGFAVATDTMVIRIGAPLQLAAAAGG